MRGTSCPVNAREHGLPGGRSRSATKSGTGTSAPALFGTGGVGLSRQHLRSGAGRSHGGTGDAGAGNSCPQQVLAGAEAHLLPAWTLGRGQHQPGGATSARPPRRTIRWCKKRRMSTLSRRGQARRADPVRGPGGGCSTSIRPRDNPGSPVGALDLPPASERMITVWDVKSLPPGLPRSGPRSTDAAERDDPCRARFSAPAFLLICTHNRLIARRTPA